MLTELLATVRSSVDPGRHVEPILSSTGYVFLFFFLIFHIIQYLKITGDAKVPAQISRTISRPY